MRTFLEKTLKYEFALIYAAFWWHEAVRGKRAIVLPLETIKELEELLGNIPIDPETRFGDNGQTDFAYVAQRMRDAAHAPEHEKMS